MQEKVKSLRNINIIHSFKFNSCRSSYNYLFKNILDKQRSKYCLFYHDLYSFNFLFNSNIFFDIIFN